MNPYDDPVDLRPFHARGDQFVGCGHIVTAGHPLFELRCGTTVTTMCPACLDVIGQAVLHLDDRPIALH